jgi:hypothetical protein
MDAYKILQDRVTEYIQFSRKRAVIYNWIYRVARSLIIVLSASAASAAKFGPQSTSHFEVAVPYFCLTVAILAAFEAWLKPSAVYRAHYQFNDRYITLETKLSLIEANDRKALEHFAEELDQVDEKYRKAVQD